MRKHYTNILKEFFQEKLFYRRVDLGITQEEMAHRLQMASQPMLIWITEKLAVALLP